MPINKYFFCHNHTRNVITVFGTIFNNIKVQRDNGKEIKIPLIFGPKSRWYFRGSEDKDLTRRHAITYPRMGFNITSFVYDGIRKLGSTQRLIGNKLNDSVNSTFAPVPYNLSISLFIATKTLTDGLQILEQILPYFRPSFNVTLEELSDPPIERDIPITLVGVTHEDNAEGGFDSTRLFEWTLDFDIEMNYFGPVTNQGLIRKVQVAVHAQPTDWSHRTTVLIGVPDPTTAGPNDEWTWDANWTDYDYEDEEL